MNNVLKRYHYFLLENKDFFKLWISQILAQPANSILHFILVLRLYELTRSNFLVSIYVAAAFVPAIIFSTWAGVIADSLNRRSILIVTNFLRAVIIGIIFLFFNSPLAILILALLFAAISQFFGPAETSSIPNLVKPKQLFLANSLFSFTLYASFLIGFSAAGPLILAFKMNKVLLFLVFIYILAAFFDYLLPALDQHLQSYIYSTLTLKKAIKISFKRLIEGFRFIKDNKLVFFVMLQVVFVFTVERSIIALVPALSEQIVKIQPHEISYFIITPIGIGAVMGAVVANRLKYHWSKNKMINVGIFVDGLILILITLYHPLEKFLGNAQTSIELFILMRSYVVFLAFLSGLVDPLILICAQTILHERTPMETRGRIFGNLNLLMNVIGIVPVLFIGFVASIISVNAVLIILGMLTIFVALIGALLLKLKKITL